MWQIDVLHVIYSDKLVVYILHTELRDYCVKDIFHAECPMGEVIEVEEAQYGRMKLGTCLKLDIGFMDCFR